MAITKRHKVLAGVCAIGLAVVLFDRLQDKSPVPGPGQAAAAVAVSEPSPTSTAAPAAASVGAAPATRGEPINTILARRLRQATGEPEPPLTQLRDLFQPDAAWLAVATAAAPAVDPDKVKAEDFFRQHKLQAVLVFGERRQAVIDSKTVQVGDSWDGFLVQSITDRAVVLTCGSAQVTLELPK